MKATLYFLLVVVAAAAAVLSFTTLRDLALVCGFTEQTAWLLPVVVDVGAAAGTLTWLARDGAARAYGRVLALTLLGLSVAGNALGHGLAAAQLAPHWGVVVLVSAVAPAVLGATVHLAVLAGRTAPDPQPAEDPVATEAEAEVPSPAAELTVRTEPAPGDVAPAAFAEPDGDRVRALIAQGAGRRRLARELSVTEHQARELLAEHRERVPA